MSDNLYPSLLSGTTHHANEVFPAFLYFFMEAIPILYSEDDRAQKYAELFLSFAWDGPDSIRQMWLGLSSDMLQRIDLLKRMSKADVDDYTLRDTIAQNPKPGIVYLLQDAEVTYYCKIGRTTNPKERITQFDIKLPFRVKVLHTIVCRDCVSAEKELHARYAEKRVRGEWFNLTDGDIQTIRSIEHM